jgi:hypothetical protein
MQLKGLQFRNVGQEILRKTQNEEEGQKMRVGEYKVFTEQHTSQVTPNVKSLTKKKKASVEF